MGELSLTKSGDGGPQDRKFQVGDIKTTIREDLSDDWILCDGGQFDAEKYPLLVAQNALHQRMAGPYYAQQLSDGTGSISSFVKGEDGRLFITKGNSVFYKPVSNFSGNWTEKTFPGLISVCWAGCLQGKYLVIGNSADGAALLWSNAVDGPYTSVALSSAYKFQSGGGDVTALCFKGNFVIAAGTVGKSDETKGFHVLYSADLVTWIDKPMIDGAFDARFFAAAVYGEHLVIFWDRSTGSRDYFRLCCTTDLATMSDSELTNSSKGMYSAGSAWVVGTRLYYDQHYSGSITIFYFDNYDFTKRTQVPQNLPSSTVFARAQAENGDMILVSKTTAWKISGDTVTKIADITTDYAPNMYEAYIDGVRVMYLSGGQVIGNYTNRTPVLSQANAQVYIRGK